MRMGEMWNSWSGRVGLEYRMRLKVNGSVLGRDDWKDRMWVYFDLLCLGGQDSGFVWEVMHSFISWIPLPFHE